jgi:NAD(P)-dependent dehydrogenase (short-subunit alcohol dehydrogenase family)
MIAKQPAAVVTGGGSGLGRAFCVELARRGGKVVVADLNLAGAEETAQLVQRAGGQAHAVHCDVTQIDQIESVARVAEEHFGAVDVVINNAGVAVGGLVGDVTLEDWRWIVSINLWGVIHGCHVFAPKFRARGRGAIINVASAAGLISTPEMGPYNVTKAAVVALSETMHVELAPHGVSVTVLCPTFFRTNIANAARGAAGDIDQRKAVIHKLMDRSKLQANDVARAALEGADRGDLYVVPMQDGQWGWRLKRLSPERFYRTLVPRLMKRLRK